MGTIPRWSSRNTAKIEALSELLDARKLRKRLKEALGIRTRDPELYREALRHRSALFEGDRRRSYERLEFLGDAVLDAIVSDQLFHHYPDADEGFLTRMRSKLVSRERLNRLAEDIGIFGLLDHRIEDGKLQDVGIGGDAIEALVGAHYLDKGYKKTARWALKTLVGPLDIERLQNTETDPKSRLIEWAQKEDKEVLFQEAPSSGDSHRTVLSIDGEEVSQGEGKSKKKAEQKAAQRFFQDRDEQEGALQRSSPRIS